MTLKEAENILGKNEAICEDDTLFNEGWYLHWEPGFLITLDGKFTVEELEAIITWVKHYIKPKKGI